MMIELAIFGLGVPELLIILAVVLLLFGGSRLAGLGKSTGRALKEFKEETKGLKGDQAANDEITGTTTTTTQPPTSQPATPDQLTPNPVQDPAPNDLRKDN
jgi:sec-independent protein translocase protein TatA